MILKQSKTNKYNTKKIPITCRTIHAYTVQPESELFFQ